MVSIKDVAEKADVSISTVSRVLNGHPNVSDEKKKQVSKAVDELDYIPNALARGLVTRSTYSVGILISDIANDFYSILVRSMEDVLNKEGYFTVIGNTDWNKEKEKNYLNYFLQKQVDGFILASTILQEEEIKKIASDLPVVLLDRNIKGEGIDRIRIDDVRGGYLAAEHLIDMGYKQLVHITGPDGIASSEDRKKGFTQAVENRNFPLNKVDFIPGHYVEQAGYEAAEDFFTPPNNFTSIGIFSANDAMAFGVLKYLNEHKFSCPHRVGLVGFDDISLAGYTNPPLTSISRPITKIGQQAGKLLLQRMTGNSKEKKGGAVEFDVALVKRQSTIKQNH